MKEQRDTVGRLLILGLDGATFDVLGPLMDRGELPALAEIRREGVSAPLRSTFCALTAPAWVSFMTGKNPGKHGIFDFAKPMREDLSFRMNSYASIRSRTLWDLVNEAGRAVGLINLPMTYPAPPLRGFVLAGLGAPAVDERFAHPPTLPAELEPILGPYIIDVYLEKYASASARDFLCDLLLCTERRAAYVRHLMAEADWDVLVAVFVGMDRIQHKLWEYVEEGGRPGRGRDPEVAALVARYFRLMDEVIGDLRGRLGPGDALLILSDHGFGGLEKEIAVNRWLKRRGLLACREATLLARRGARRILGLRRALLEGLGLTSREREFARRLSRAAAGVSRPRFDPIIWERTRAYTASRTQQGTYVNLRGREPQGIVSPGEEYEAIRDSLIEGLSSLTDPDTGGTIPAEVKRREEVYHGPYLEEAPDVVYLFRGGAVIATHELEGGLFLYPNWARGTGMHRPEGILMAAGWGVRQGARHPVAEITDVAPTAAYLLGVPVPEDMDGVVLEGILEEGMLARRPVVKRRAPDGEGARAGGEVYGEVELERIREQLKGLGYIT